MINLKYQRSCWWSRNFLPWAEYRFAEEGDKSCPFPLLSQFTAAKIVISKIFLLSLPFALRCDFSIDHGRFIDISSHMKAKPHEKRANLSEWNRNYTLRADRWPCTSMYSDLNISLFFTSLSVFVHQYGNKSNSAQRTLHVKSPCSKGKRRIKMAVVP